MGFHCGPAARGGPAARRQQRRRARTGAGMAHLRAARVGPVACGARVRRGARKPRPWAFRNADARDRAGARRHTPRRDDAHDRQSDDWHRRRAQPHRHGRADAKHGAVAHHHHRRRGPHARTHHERAAQGDRGAEPAHHLAAVCAERAGCAAHDSLAHAHRQSGRARRRGCGRILGTQLRRGPGHGGACGAPRRRAYRHRRALRARRAGARRPRRTRGRRAGLGARFAGCAARRLAHREREGAGAGGRGPAGRARAAGVHVSTGWGRTTACRRACAACTTR